MKHGLRYLIVFLFIFTVMEHTGVTIAAACLSEYAEKYEPAQTNEDAEESAEKAKQTLEEYYHSVGAYLSPEVKSVSVLNIPFNKTFSWSFYPPIPTPPPDRKS